MVPFFHLCFMFVFVILSSVPCSLEVSCWEMADLLALLCVMFFFHFRHFPIWCPGSGVVLDLFIN